MIWSAILCLVAVALTLFILNTVLGLLVFYVDSSQSIYWHSLSPYWITVLVLIMMVSVILEFYVFRSGGHSLAKQLGARRLTQFESTPEESTALKLTEQLADTFQIPAPTVYVLPDEIGVNALTAGFSHKDIVIILTWGALQNLDEQELYGLLSHEFNHILSGETIDNTNLKSSTVV